MTVEELQVLITAQTSGLEKQLNSVKAQLGGLEKTASRTSGKLSSAFKSMFKGFSVVAIVAGLTKLGKQAVSTASDLQEVQNVVDVAFGSAAEEINKFASSAIQQLGMSEYTAKHMASTFMSMSNGMGIAADSGKNMSIGLTKLAGDMASFYNVEQDVAQTALNSVFTGETESLKKFGVVMTEANLSAFAMSQGITKSYQAMSQSEKVMLRYQYVMNATKNAQGDFARTSNSWANQTRILKEQWSQLLGIIGKGLIQVLTPVVQALNKLLGYLISIGNAIAKIFGGNAVKSTAASVSDAAAGAGGLADGMGETAEGADAANASAKKLQKTLGSFDELNVMADNSNDGGGSDAGGGDTGALGDIGTDITATTDTAEEQTNGVIDKIKAKLEEFKAWLEPIGKAFLDAFKFDELKGQFLGLIDGAKQKILEFVGTLDFSKYQGAFINLASAIGGYANAVLSGMMTLIGTIGGDLFDAFSPFFTEVINNLIPTFINVLSGAYNILTTLTQEAVNVILAAWNSIKPVFDLIGQILKDLAAMITEFWDNHGAMIVGNIQQAIVTLSGVLQNFFNTIVSPIIQNICKVVKNLWDNHLKGVFKKVMEVIADVIELITVLWNNVLGPVVNFIIDKVGPPIVKVVNTIVKVVGKVIEDIVDFIGGLLDVLDGVIEFLIGVFTGDWDRAWEGIKQILHGVWEAIKAIVKAAIDIVAGILEAAWTLITQVLTAAWNLIKGIFKTVWDAIKSIFSSAVDAIKPLLEKAWNAIKNTITTVWNAIKSFFTTIWDGIKTLFTNALNAIKSGIETAFNAIKSFITNAMNAIKSAINTVMNAIKNIFSTVLSAIQNLWTNMCNGVKNLVSTLKTNLTNIVNGIKDTFTKVFTAVKEKVTGLFSGMKNTVVNIMNGLKNAIKTPINGIIGFINGLVRGVVNGINGMIKAMNKLKFDVPDWVPGIGGKKFGFNISQISAPQIPMLANGGVITSPTVAMMGEYAGARSNPEIVAPQSIMRETMAEANNDLIDTLIQLNRQLISAIGALDMEVKIGDDTIANSVVRANNKALKMTGYGLI